MKRCLLFVLALLLALPLFAPALAQEDDEAQAEPTPFRGIEFTEIQIGILPVSNVYPYAGYLLGHYEAEGSSPSLQLSASAADLREQILDGTLAGFQADLITALVLLDAGVDLRVVRHVGMASPAQFGLVSGADSGIMSAEELRGARIGVSLNTVVQYVTELMLASVGIGIDEVELVNVPNIRTREEMLTAGELAAATLPEPLLYQSLQGGAILLIDDSVVDYVPEALVFTVDTLTGEADQVRRFLSAYEKVVRDLNRFSTYEAGIQRMGGEALLAQVRAIAEQSDHPTVHLWNLLLNTPLWPALDEARVPTEAEFAHAQDWALAAGLVSEARAYEDVVDGSYLPEAMASDDAADDGDGDE